MQFEGICQICIYLKRRKNVIKLIGLCPVDLTGYSRDLGVILEFLQITLVA